MEPPELPPSLHAHRLDHNSSKLPTYRHVDLRQGLVHARMGDLEQQNSTQTPAVESKLSPREHARTQSANNIAVATSDAKRLPFPRQERAQTFNCTSDFPASTSNFDPDHTTAIATATKPPKARIPASHSRNGLAQEFWDDGRPPPAMITQRSFKPETQTKDWIAAQSIAIPPTTGNHDQTPPSPAQPKSSRSSTDSSQPRPLIKPIRGFKPSSRRSVEMASSRMSSDPDSTLRALEGFESRSPSNQPEQEETNSDESDLFLRAAREEEIAQQANTVDGQGRTDKRRSRIGQRASLPPSTPLSHPSISRRRGSDLESSNGSRHMDEQEVIGHALTYRPSGRDRPTALDDINRSRYYGANSRSNPTTPRPFPRPEISPESQASYGGRRPSVPEHTLPSRSSAYRQSNLSYSTPRTYNSSPLVSRSTDMHMHDTPEQTRGAEGTESTVSTTAPSTVWDELEDLKSRIHRLELTGKLPATSGAAISRASNDRPATATTTVTTMSSSPKRGRNNSISPIDSATVEFPAEVHPLLYSALAKSKPLLSPEIYKTLEATAFDAIAIASMMGSSGQPGPISSSQSTIGGPAAVTDRQVRRKADSLCRSLTELCLALSEGRNDHVQQVTAQTSTRPSSRDTEVRSSIEPNNQRQPMQPIQPMSQDLVRAKSSPRALSRLEARRSSLLSGSALPSARYAPSEGNTPTQSSMAGRRTSLLLRSRRGGTEEPEEEDETRFRAPSRAATDLGRVRNSPREYVSQQPLPERPKAIQSSLPVRRHYTSTSLTNTGAPSMPPVSSLGGRRYLDRSTPERDTTSLAGRLAEDRSHRKSSIGLPSIGRTGSLTRKTRQPNSTDLSSAGQNGSYQ